ncbi:MAG: DUF1929 domain-containing protein, partial [Gammaproteobacteria bacterium]|nr:DUF1929 domain-containing protein [Gammaproteobacteria bacterium]
MTEIDHPTHDMFCAHVVMLENGQPFVSGGRNSGNSPWTSVFDFTTDQWVPLNIMNQGRWYPTSVALADGTVFTAIGSGGGNTGESYDSSTGTWQLETGLNFNPMILDYPDSSYGERNWWPLFHLAPDGQIFHSGPTPQMHFIDTSGLGTATPVGPQFSDWYPKHGTSVMYEEGKLLTAGGWMTGTATASSNKAITIDITGPSPVVTATSDMNNARKFHNGVVLPNGEVLVVGGNTSGLKFNDSGSIYAAELWNPQTGVWRELAAASVPRNYHSVALLLTDGTVLSAGGGLCNCAADHADGQVYSPPYLFNADGSPAIRPTILSAPAAIRPGDVFDVRTDTNIERFSLIKMSSTTHAVNTDLRQLETTFSGPSGDYQLTANGNPNVLTPGYWMLFAMNSQGTPSVAHVVQVRSPNLDDPPEQSTLEFAFSTLGDLASFVLNGDAHGVGNVLRLTDNAGGQTGSAYYGIPVSIGGNTSFSTRAEWRAHGSQDGAAGLAFVVQGNGSGEIGGGDAGLGIGGVGNSLAIEIDYWQDSGGDPDDNHIAVTVAGNTNNHVGSVFSPFDLEDGNSHVLWIDYDGNSDNLEIYLGQNTSDAKPALPILTIPSLDLPAIIGSRGYFGFTAATGSTSNYHDIEAWSLAVGYGGESLVVDPIVAPPQSGGGPVEFSASATGTGLQYSWSFGDGSPQTAFSPVPTVSHNYTQAGRYYVTLIVRDVNGNEQTIQFVQAVYPILLTNAPRSSTPILYDNNSGSPRVWSVNPDNDTVTVIDASTNLKLAEITVGDSPRTLAITPGGMVWVANKESDDISIIDGSTLAVVEGRDFAPGSRPHGLVIDESGSFAFVALEESGLVLKLDIAAADILGSVDVGWRPRHLAVTGDSSKLFVSRFISPPFPGESTIAPQTEILGDPVGGEVVVIDAAAMQQTDTIVLQHSNRLAAEHTGPGFPNYLGPAIISPTGLTAWVPSKQDNILRGSSRNNLPLDHDHTVRAVSSVFDPFTGQEDLGGRVDHDNASVASNGAFGKYGIYLFIALEGNRQVAVVDALGHDEILRFSTDFAPQGIAISDDGYTLFVHNFMGRSVTVVDISDLVNGVAESVDIITTISTVANESLDAAVLHGKRLFYDASDPRLAAESY